MRSLIPFATLLAGCATSPATEEQIPARGETAGYTCRTTGLDAFVGKVASAETGAAMLRQSGARTLRWTAPDIAVTMDLRQDRLNVELDSTHQRIVGANCG